MFTVDDTFDPFTYLKQELSDNQHPDGSDNDDLR